MKRINLLAFLVFALSFTSKGQQPTTYHVKYVQPTFRCTYVIPKTKTQCKHMTKNVSKLCYQHEGRTK